MLPLRCTFPRPFVHHSPTWHILRQNTNGCGPTVPAATGTGNYSFLPQTCPGISAYIRAATRDEPFFVAPSCAARDFGTEMYSNSRCAIAADSLGYTLTASLRSVLVRDDDDIGGTGALLNDTGVCIIDPATREADYVSPDRTPSAAEYLCQLVYGCTEEDWRMNRSVLSRTCEHIYDRGALLISDEEFSSARATELRG